MSSGMFTYLTSNSGLPVSRSRLLQRKCACGNQTVGAEQCEACSSAGNSLQKHLSIGSSNDPLEREADQVANRVVLNQSVSVSRASPAIQRSASADSGIAAAAPASVEQTLSGAGTPLGTEIRTMMEQRIGHDFSGVRVHTDHTAGKSAREVHANAYTVGNDVVFAPGRYAPHTREGTRLIAHELTHVVQQSSASSVVRRQEDGSGLDASPPSPAPAPGPTAPSASAPAAAPVPAANAAATSPHGRGCAQSNCADEDRAVMDADLSRSISWLRSARQALGAQPLSSNTESLLDWYFNSDSEATAATLRHRIGCIENSLNYAKDNSWWGCDPLHSASAYADMVAPVSFCANQRDLICLTNNHFGNGAREKSTTLIHEGAHLQGFSLGILDNGVSFPDIYSWKPGFATLSTAGALQNADSVAYFCRAVATGVSPSFRIVLEGGAGGALGNQSNTWIARGFLGVEARHPVLGLVNPRLGIGATVFGEPLDPGASFDPDRPGVLVSLLPGIRLTDPRPGPAGSGFAVFEAGPSVIIDPGSIRPGAELGLGIGYRWQMLEFSGRLGGVLDPTNSDEDARARLLISGGAGISGVF